EPMHLNVNANANPVSLVLNHLRLESQLLFFACVPKFSQNVDAREKHLCLADSEPKVTVKAMDRASILKHFNNRKAVQVAFFERKSRIIWKYLAQFPGNGNSTLSACSCISDSAAALA